MTSDEIGSAVANWATGEPFIRRVYLFGSRAKGKARPDSDIDLAILHDIDPAVRPTCDPSQAHHFTWEKHGQRWAAALQAQLKGLVTDVEQLSRSSPTVRAGLKECRICLYRRV